MAITMQKTFVIVVWGVLAWLRSSPPSQLVLATPRVRRILAPLVLGAVAVASARSSKASLPSASALPQSSTTTCSGGRSVRSWRSRSRSWPACCGRASPVRPSATSASSSSAHRPRHSRSLRRALGDPTLKIVFWLPERKGYVDAAGRGVELPTGPAGAVTHLQHEGEPLAALVHDPSLREEPRLVGAAGAAAGLALGNTRLHAETRAQLEEVQ